MERKIVSGTTLTFLMLSVIIVLAGKASSLPVTAQANSTAMVYSDPPTINGTAIGVNNTVTVNIMIRDAQDIYGWQIGLTFNATLLNCTGFFEGEFLSDIGSTYRVDGAINNTAGTVWPPYACAFWGDYLASSDGRLAYATFKVKEPGVSDIHLRDVLMGDNSLPLPKMIPVNIIDVYTVILDTTPYTVVTVSNSTGSGLDYASGFYGHAFIPSYGISFKVTGPYSGFSNVTVPETLMSGAPSGWAVLLDGIPTSKTVTCNGTHYSVYFTYSSGTHTIQITSPYAIPEFPSVIILPLFMFFTLTAVAITKKITIKETAKKTRTPPNTNN